MFGLENKNYFALFGTDLHFLDFVVCLKKKMEKGNLSQETEKLSCFVTWDMETQR